MNDPFKETTQEDPIYDEIVEMSEKAIKIAIFKFEEETTHVDILFLVE